MKLLWYTDALYFKRYGQSMTGLVYKHMPLGALPVAFDEILNFELHGQFIYSWPDGDSIIQIALPIRLIMRSSSGCSLLTGLINK